MNIDLSNRVLRVAHASKAARAMDAVPLDAPKVEHWLALAVYMEAFGDSEAADTCLRRAIEAE